MSAKRTTPPIAIEMVPIASLVPWDGNPRDNDGAVRAVTRSIEAFGWTNPILARKADRVVIAGHTRLKAAAERGLAEVPVIFLDMTEAEAHLYNIVDNQTAQIATWNMPRLTEAMAALGDLNMDLTLTGFDRAMLSRLNPGAGGDDFNVEEALRESENACRVERGQVWACGDHRVMCGDSTSAEDVAQLMAGEKAAAVFTDPPYGQNQLGVPGDEPENHARLIGAAVTTLPLSNGICVAFASPRTFPIWLDAARAAAMKFERMLWLYKEAQMVQPWRGWLLTSEAILVCSIGDARWIDVHPYVHDCYKISEVSGELSGGAWHGAVKPIAVVADILSRIAALNAIVFDPFLGSGTTLIAAERLGCRCYGMEIEPRYVQVALARWEAETGGQAVLADDGSASP